MRGWINFRIGALLALFSGLGITLAVSQTTGPSFGSSVRLAVARLVVTRDPILPDLVKQVELLHASDAFGGNTNTGFTALGVKPRRLVSSRTGALASTGALSEIKIWGDGTHVDMAAPAALFDSTGKPLAPQAIQALAPEGGDMGVTIGGDPANPGASTNFTFTLVVLPAQISRAYLVYELSGALHWSEVARSINGGVSAGGEIRGDSSKFTLQAEPISPSVLRAGANTVVFSNTGSLAPYQLRHVQLVVEPLDGWNAISDATSNEGDAASVLNGDVTTGWTIYPDNLALRAVEPTLVASLLQMTAADSVGFQLSAPLTGSLSVDVQGTSGWQTVAVNLPAGQFIAGWNKLSLPGSPISALRLRFNGGDGATILSELTVTGSPVGSRDATPALAITFPDQGQFFGDVAYVRGFLMPPAKAVGAAKIIVGGKSVPSGGGAFETAVSQADLGIAPGSKSWSVDVDAVYPDGTHVKQTVNFTNSIDAHHADPASAALTVDLLPGIARVLANSGATLEIGADALTKRTRVVMQRLNAVDLAALDPGLVNITKGYGFRFLPHGHNFVKPAKVHIPYDRAKLPAGMTENDIKTFYYDGNLRSWRPLTTAGVDPVKSEIIAVTTHFTDMISGVVQTPDAPDTASFNPTQIKDLKAADPGAKVNLVAAPSANAMGDVKLSYPIEVPPGRTGHAPQLALSYDSSAVNGWLGMGWTTATSRVMIDTRWGVPRYDGVNETETYMLDGEQLAPVAHRGPLVPRLAERTFHTRVEGGFRKITRHGGSPSTFWWEIREKDGTASFYGGDPASGGPVADATLTDGTGNISQWLLRLVQDTNGNTIHYNYARVADSGTGGGLGGVPGTQLYIQAIDYTGVGVTPGAYTIQFQRDRDLGEARRPDPIIDARGGFKMVTADLLRKILVSFNGQPVRSYDLLYSEGAYKKSLLTTLKQFDAGGALFNQHSFTYYDDSRDASLNYKGFQGSTQWNTGADNVQAQGPLGALNASALGSQMGSGAGGHLYVGVAPLGSDKSSSVGAKVGSNFSDSDGLLAFIDLDGDGLPDKLFQSGNTVSYRKNLSAPNGGSTTFGPLIPVATLPAISHEHTDMSSFGPEAYAGFSGINGFVGLNLAASQATQSIYFIDVNGDGLVDLVISGTVLFNRLVNGVPTFTPDSAQTPYPIGPAAVAANLIASQQAALSAKLDAANPKVDTIRRWVAPFAGTITITAPFNLVQDTSQARANYATADGVRVAIQLNGAELFAAVIGPSDYAVKTPTGVTNVAVQKGDILYFRVQSVNDGAFDQVAWTPQIAYQGVPATLDSNDFNPYAYDEFKDFTLQGLRQAMVVAPLDGTVNVIANLNKLAPTSDDVSLILLKNGSVVALQLIAGGRTGVTIFSQTLSVQKSQFDNQGHLTQAGDKLELRLAADSRVDVTKLVFDPTNPPTIAYTASPDIPQGNALPSLEFPVGVDLYADSDQTQALAAFVAPVSGSFSFDAQISGATAGTVIVTAKSPGVLLAKQTLSLPGGGGSVTAPLTFTANQGDQIFFEFHARDPQAAANVSAYSVTPQGGGATVPAALYSATPTDILPQDFRGWTHFGYNGQGANAVTPIVITAADLTMSAAQGVDPTAYRQGIVDAINNGSDPSAVIAMIAPFTTNVVPYMPKTAQSRWQGPDASLWANAAQMSSSRRGTKFIPSPNADPFAGATAVAKISHTDTRSFAGGGGTAIIQGSVSFSGGTSHAILDFKDLNGDGFPDVVTSGLTVQYSPMTGGLESTARAVNGASGDAENSSNSSNSFGLGGTYAFENFNAHADGDARGGGGRAGGRSGGNTGLQMPSLSLGGSISSGNSTINYDLLDINGDGLPDKVSVANGVMTVELNLGYGFAAPEVWDAGSTNAVNSGQNAAAGVNGGGGFNDGIFGFGGGINLSDQNSKSVVTLYDINGDGLLDRVTKTGIGFLVGFNSGSGFAPDVLFPSGIVDEITKARQSIQGGGLYFTTEIPIPPLVSIIINPGADFEATLGRNETVLADIDGDGFPDFLASTSDGTINASINTRGRTNLLKGVTRPLGGFFTVDYTRSGDTFAQPGNRWVLSSLVLNDGQPGDGQDTQVTSYAWSGGFFERREREFFGFAQCVESHLDPANANALFRTVTRNYNNSTYYLKGLLAEETLADAQGRKFTDAAYSYLVRDEATQAPLVNPSDLQAVAFPQLVRMDKSWFEGQLSPGKTTFMTYAYDKFGNVIDYVDSGDKGPTGVVESQIAYLEDLSTYVVGKAKAITVLSGGQTARQRTASFQPGTGNLLEVVKTLADGTQAVTDMSYDAFGNIASLTGPSNATGQRYAFTYTYDPTVNTYVTAVTDSFGYTSTADYDLRFGLMSRSTDINNQTMTTAYDNAGRPASLVGPYQQGTGLTTIAMEYHPEAQIPWARTKHLDLNRGTSTTIDLETFIDGLKRATQMKKSLALHGSGNVAHDVTAVSGRVTFDGFGRPIQQFYPITEPLGQQTVFNPIFDPVQPTVSTYDVLDRPLTVANPANETTAFVYDFGPDRNTQPSFRTTITDANGIPREIFRDVRDDITSVRLVNNGGTVSEWTSYAYDALEQIVSVTDDKGNVTSAAYDNFGRRVSITSPDAGRTDYAFDPASNLTAKITANLRAAGQQVSYAYQFNRLASVTYPQFPGNNVAYTYGAPVAPGNTANRVSMTTTQGSTTQRSYGPLGEIIQEIKTINTDNGPHPTFTSNWVFDTWNRIRSLTYPDGEVLTFNYDSGGLIQTISGLKTGTTYPYLNFMGYDKFEARERVAFGNGTASDYAYSPLNRRLAGILAQTPANRVFMNMSYGYDAVGNVKSLANSAPLPRPNLFGGPTNYSFGYDDLYQLTSASGTFASPPNKQQQFTLALSYDSIHNITRKTQNAVTLTPGGNPIPDMKITYDFQYAYTGPRPHAATHIGTNSYLYDLNGNQAGFNSDTSGQLRRIIWDEDNRIQAVADQGRTTSFKYDDDTARVIKRGPGGETLYVNDWYVAAPGRNNKHVFAGATRISTKLEMPPKSQPPDQQAPPAPTSPTEKFRFFYHPDHLGSTGYVTDETGEVFQHLEYFPFGETWVDEASNDSIINYRFTGKEFDQETGLYYFGARYYDPRTSAWQNPDTALGAHLNATKAAFTWPRRTTSWRSYATGPGMGGAFNPKNLNSFGYGHQNPMTMNDPDGNTPIDIIFVAYDVYQIIKDPSVENAVALGLDVVGTVTPAEGLGVIYRGARAAQRAGEVIRGGEKAVEAERVIQRAVETERGLADGVKVTEEAVKTEVQGGKTVGELREAGERDAHHVIQDAAVRDIKGYQTNAAPGVQLQGPSNVRGTPHYEATQVQRQSGGGTYGAERRIGYKALRRAGRSKEEARGEIERADKYFNNLGVTKETETRIPGNRPNAE
jgi:RHS repeat-associated protein